MSTEQVDRPGHFIAFEGIEGSGKSTQAALLAKHLRENGFEVIEVKEPGGTDVGLAIREIFLSMNSDLHPITEVGLLVSAKAQLIHKVIIPALEQGKVVICDRYTDSLYAYQWFAKGTEKTVIDRLLVASSCVLWPDLSIMVDIPTEVSAQRVAARRGSGGEVNVFDTKPLEFVQATRAGIKQSYNIHRRGDKKTAIVEGVGSIAEVTNSVVGVVDNYMKGKFIDALQ